MRSFLMLCRNIFIALGTAALSGGALFFTLYHLFFRVIRVFVVGGVQVWNHPLFPAAGWTGCLLLPLLVILAPNRRKALSRLAAAVWPWLLLWPLLLMQPGLIQLALLTWSIGWGAFRLGWLFGPVIPEQKLSPIRTNLLLLVIWLMAAIYGCRAQFLAHISLFFIYGDWSQYAEHYLALLSGKTAFGAWLAGAGHFNPLVNLVMTCLLAVWRGPETVFAVNALLVSSAVPLAYLLARRHGASAGLSLVLALAAALNPALSHQYLGFIYGFHPVAFLVPLILGFMLLEKSRWKWLLFALSLGVQETAAVFWFGYGLYSLCRKQYRTGAILLLAMPCWFFAVGHWILPWAFGTAQYTQSFHYAALGKSLPEVALSPILRPRAFFSAVLQKESVSFLLCVLVPLWFAAGRKWVWIVAALPLVAGVCMQDSSSVKTIALQYSMEISVWLLAVSAMTMADNTVPRWWRAALPPGCAAAGSAAGLLTATILSWLLFGFAEPYGKYTTAKGRFSPDIRPALEKCLEKFSGPRRVIASSRFRNHFLFRCPTCSILTEPAPGDLVILLLNDRVFDADQEFLRRKIFLRTDAEPVLYGGNIVAYRIGEHCSKPALPIISAEEFASFGEEMVLNDPHFRARRLRLTDKTQLFLRVEKTPDYDTDMEIVQPATRRTFRLVFGDGIVPAYGCPPGSVWTCELPVQNFCRLQIRERPGSAAAFQTIKEAK